MMMSAPAHHPDPTAPPRQARFALLHDEITNSPALDHPQPASRRRMTNNEISMPDILRLQLRALDPPAAPINHYQQLRQQRRSNQNPHDDTSATHITLATYNVVSARKTRLLLALRAMADINTDIAVLTETKLTSGRHAKTGHGYSVFASSATSPSQGGVALIWRKETTHWTLEGMRVLSANSVSATLVSGDQRWLLLGTYISPNVEPDAELNVLEIEARRHPRLPVILLGDLNADLDDIGNARSIAIGTTMQHLGATDIFRHFPQKKNRRHTRHHTINGTTHRSRCDYALVDEAVDVRSMRLIIPPKFHSDHWAVKIQIRSSNLRMHQRYLRNRASFPTIPPVQDEHGPNLLFQQLMQHHTRHPPMAYPPRDAWIAEDTWRLIDQRTTALKRLATPAELNPLRKEIRKHIRRDRAARLQQTGEEIEAHLDADDPREAWRLVKVWYRQHARATPPTPADLTAIGREYQALYTRQEPPGEPIRGLVTYAISDATPGGEEIATVLRTLHNGRAPGASGMRVEDLKRWYAEREVTPAPWYLIIQLVQHAFTTGIVPTCARSNTLVLIPKPEPGQVRGIGLLEPIWKLVSAIINMRMMAGITFHDDLHGFLPARGTGTACLEAKLSAQLAYRTGNPLHHVYIDFAKAYDSLDRGRTLLLLADYGVGPKTLRLISTFWDRHMVIPRQQAFFGDPFHADRGLATGDIPAPLFYNVVTDAILRKWYLDGATTGMTTKARFYADDGELWDHDPAQLQRALTDLENLFRRMGLLINGSKTKALTTLPTVATTRISTTAYKRRMEGNGDTYRARKQLRTICPACDVAMQMRSLKGHYRTQHPNLPMPPMDAPPTLQDPDIRAYTITAHDKHAPAQCPVPACGVTMHGGWFNMRRHFHFRHPDIDITIAEEGTLPRCSDCGFQCPEPHEAHKASKFCMRGQRCNTRRTLTQQIIQVRQSAPVLQAGNTELATVASFKYLGRWMSADDSDTMAVTQNIAKARARWGQLCRILTRQGASRRIMGLFYKATTQAVLLHGAETWALSQPLLRMLRSFHHRCARYLARMVNIQLTDGSWNCPPSHLALEKAGLFTIEEYIQRRVNTFLPYIQTRNVYSDCQNSRATQSTANHPVWWAAHPPLPPQPVPAIAAAPDVAVVAPNDNATQLPTPAPPRRSPRRETIWV